MAEISFNQPINENQLLYIKTWKDYINNYHPKVSIDISKIIAEQKEQVKHYDFNGKAAIEIINNELVDRQPVQINGDEVEDNVVKSIENTPFHNLKERFQQAEEQGRGFSAELKLLLEEYRQIVDKFSNLQKDPETGLLTANYQSLDAIGKSMFKLQNNIDQLYAYLGSSESAKTFEDFRKLRVVGSKTKTPSLKSGKGGVSLIRQLAGIGTALKGLDLEKEAVEKILSRMPEEFKVNTQTVRTGSIRVLINGHSVDIKEDVSIFDMTNDSMIQLADGTQETLQNLIAKANSGETVTVSLEGYQALQKAMITAVSAKSTKQGSRIQLHAGLTVNRILNEVQDRQDTEYWLLFHMKQINNSNPSFKGGNLPLMSYTVNYNMSKMLTKIIGLKNDFLVTNEGFISMYEFLSKKLDDGKYVSAKPASLANAMSIGI